MLPLHIVANESDDKSSRSAVEKQDYEGEAKLCRRIERGAASEVSPESCFVLYRIRKDDIALASVNVPQKLFVLASVSHGSPTNHTIEFTATMVGEKSPFHS